MMIHRRHTHGQEADNNQSPYVYLVLLGIVEETQNADD